LPPTIILPMLNVNQIKTDIVIDININGLMERFMQVRLWLK